MEREGVAVVLALMMVAAGECTYSSVWSSLAVLPCPVGTGTLVAVLQCSWLSQPVSQSHPPTFHALVVVPFIAVFQASPSRKIWSKMLLACETAPKAFRRVVGPYSIESIVSCAQTPVARETRGSKHDMKWDSMKVPLGFVVSERELGDWICRSFVWWGGFRRSSDNTTLSAS